MSYSVFARFYDKLTNNIDYPKRADYFRKLLNTYGTNGKILLDLCCGTGSLSIPLANLGYDVIGVDKSPEMLSIAMQKSYELDQKILFLNQDASKLDLYGTIDACICALDSLNHITNEKTLLKVFEKVSLFLNPNGIFIFDLNSEYKHRIILNNNSFVYDLVDLYCVFSNNLLEDGLTVNVNLDFFEKLENGFYKKHSENFLERAYSNEFIEGILLKSGFELINIFESDSETPPIDKSERLVFIARKI